MVMKTTFGPHDVSGSDQSAVLRRVVLQVPDARSQSVKDRLAAQVAGLDPNVERDAMTWIEATSLFDEDNNDAR